LSESDRDTLGALQVGRDWVWIAGNHDPAPPVGLGGIVATQFAFGSLSFRHEPTGAVGEIAGHLHPYARVPTRGRAISRRCFAADGERIVMPAFGAYAGGLNIRDRAFAAILRMAVLTAHLLGEHRLHAFPAARCYV
jgi:metallophosphoesterase superfamily enzyme